MPSALAHLLRIRLRGADEGVDVVALEREERGLQGNSTDIAVVHLEWSRFQAAHSADTLRALILDTELSEQRHELS